MADANEDQLHGVVFDHGGEATGAIDVGRGAVRRHRLSRGPASAQGTTRRGPEGDGPHPLGEEDCQGRLGRHRGGPRRQRPRP